MTLETVLSRNKYLLDLLNSDTFIVDIKDAPINLAQEKKDNVKKKKEIMRQIKNNKNMFRLDSDFFSDTESSGDSDNDINGNTYDDLSDQIKTSTLNTPWIEKYRPTKVDDLVADQNTLNKIKTIISERDMPNIIITGVPGIGKTSTILCIAKNILGRYYSDGVLELNASDDRGIKSVQESIIYFCKKKLETKENIHKIVMLDEADNMTDKAQKSINHLMEEYQHSTRFAFTCNNSSDIIEAIQSRCIILRYTRLNNSQVSNRLIHICQTENVPYTKEGISAIVTVSQGDLRQAINNLQLTFNGYVDIIPENVFKLCDKPHPLVIQKIFSACNKKDVRTALICLNELRDKGYSSSDISIGMINTLKNAHLPDINENTKIKFMNEISKTCLFISKGLNTPLQLTGCICALCK